MSDPTLHDAMRPHTDEEVPEAIRRLLSEPAFIRLALPFFKTLSPKELQQKLLSINRLIRFQKEMVYPALMSVLQTTSDGLSSSGFDRLNPGKACLFISNHRDIILDSALLNILLYEKGFNTTEIAIGNNLLKENWIADLVKLNKSFVVRRDLNGRQQLEFSQQLSAYIRTNISQKNTSVWIAQRQGRTKGGNDLTQPGLLKMLSISGSDDLIANMKELQIVPVSISYEYDPCDVLKLHELEPQTQALSEQASYREDVNSIVTGIKGRKGNIHIHAAAPLNERLAEVKNTGSRNTRIQAIAQRIDAAIHQNYKVYPGNYIAADMESGNHRFSTYYTAENQAEFVQYLDHQMQQFPLPVPQLREKLIRMYAWPAFNKHCIQPENR